MASTHVASDTVGEARSDHALDVLGMFSVEHPLWTFDQIHADLFVRYGETAESLADDIQNLLEENYLEAANGAFQLGPRVFELARLARRRLGLVAVARPSMHALGAATGLTVGLAKRVGLATVLIDVAAAPNMPGAQVEPGTELPINASVAGQVLFAWSPRDDVDQLVATHPLRPLTALTITSLDQLHVRLAQIRARGWAISRSESQLEYIGLGVPIFGEDGAVRAALAIGGAEAELGEDVVAAVVPQMLNAAREISERLAIIDV